MEPYQSIQRPMYFNPLHHEGGDSNNFMLLHSVAEFQSTPPRGWRPQAAVKSTKRSEFQSTPPRGWRHKEAFDAEVRRTISIHSTTRVETLVPLPGIPHFPISIHSTTRVETYNLKSPVPFSNVISIHSTTRVETVNLPPVRAGKRNFNPLHHEGGDGINQRRVLRYMISIHSTTRVETRQPHHCAILQPISIHSTTRVETAILHNNHYYSSTHFHKQIISHPLKSRPTIPLHSQIRSHCANFPVRISP